MTNIAADILIVAAAAFLAYVAWYDFRNLKILNSSVLVLLVLYALWAALTGFATLKGDLLAGGILFAMGFLLWLLRMMGAGDAKLYLALGLFLGLRHMGLFAVLLMAVTVLCLLVLFLVRFSGAESGILGRLRNIRMTGKVPYAVLMCAAAIPVTLLRVYA